jgi:hypothetical protein
MRGRLTTFLVLSLAWGCSFNPDDLRMLRDAGVAPPLDGSAFEAAPAAVEVANPIDALPGPSVDADTLKPDLAVMDVSIVIDAALAIDVSIAADVPMTIDLAEPDVLPWDDGDAVDLSSPVDLSTSIDGSSVASVDSGVDLGTMCAPGRRRCEGTTLEVCDETGAWLGTPVAKGVCDALCTPGTFNCEYKTRQVCSATGTWKDLEQCPFVCLAGACDGECVPGTGQCNGAVPQTCDAQGKWKDGLACKYACVGQGQCGGSCQPTSSQTQCVGTTPQHCNQDGNWISDPIKKDVCNAECNPKETLACGNCGGGVQTCNALGMWGPCNNQPGSPATYYRDADGDSYGDPKVTTTSCTGAPTGYVANNLDCCDLDATAKPTQTVPRGSANLCGTFDYNCDGFATPKQYHVCCVCSSSSDVCATATCGTAITVTSCTEVTYPSYSCTTSSTKSSTLQECL